MPRSRYCPPGWGSLPGVDNTPAGGFSQLAQREHARDLAGASGLVPCSFGVLGQVDQPVPKHWQDRGC